MSALALSLWVFAATVPADDAFALTLPVSADALQQATTYTNHHHLVMYFADTKAPAFDERFARGPVARARGYAVAHGYIVTLLARDDVQSLRKALQRRTAPPSLAVAGEPSPGDVETAAKPENPQDFAARFDKKVAATSTQVTPPSAPSPAATFPFGQQTPTHVTSPWFFVAGITALSCAGVWVWSRRPRASRPRDANIDVLAVRSLGPKHQLALIDTDGERLLVCTSHNGVTLLSHLQGKDQPPNQQSSFEEVLRATDANGLRELSRQGMRA